jgi:hypothetical protein
MKDRRVFPIRVNAAAGHSSQTEDEPGAQIRGAVLIQARRGDDSRISGPKILRFLPTPADRERQ